MKTPILIAGMLAVSLSTNAQAAAFQNSAKIASNRIRQINCREGTKKTVRSGKT